MNAFKEIHGVAAWVVREGTGVWWPQDTHLKTKNLSLCLNKLTQPVSTFWSHISAIGNKITETLSSSRIRYVYVWKIKQSTPLPSSFGVSCFLQVAWTTAQHWMDRLGKESLIFPFYVGKNLERPFRENASTNFVTILCCGVLLLEFTFVWVSLHFGSFGSFGRVKSLMVKIEWKPL